MARRFNQRSTVQSVLILVSALVLFLHPVGGMANDQSSDTLSPDIQVFYFHNTYRCMTCLGMEGMTEEMIQDNFSTELETGTITWGSFDIQEPENERFVKEFGLDGIALIMVELENGKMLRWKNLEQIWELAGTPVQFREYVRGELAAYVGNE